MYEYSRTKNATTFDKLITEFSLDFLVLEALFGHYVMCSIRNRHANIWKFNSHFERVPWTLNND